MEEISRITKRRRRLRTVGEPHPWEPRHMRLTAMRIAESVGEPAERRNVTLGVIQHLWRSPVPFIGFYPPEGVKVTENRLYTSAPPRSVDDTDYLAGVEADVAPIACAYCTSDFCVGIIYDKDIEALRDDILVVAKSASVEPKLRKN